MTVTAWKAVRAVCRVMGGRPAQIYYSPRGTHEVSLRRWMAVSAYRAVHPGCSMTWVGHAFDRNRTSVKHACLRLGQEIERQPELGTLYQRVLRELG